MANLKPVYIDTSSGELKEPRNGDVLINNPEITLDTIADLRNHTSSTYPRTETIKVLGYDSIQDEGAIYWLDESDTTTSDDGYKTIVDADGGRWKRIFYERPIEVPTITDLKNLEVRFDSNFIVNVLGLNSVNDGQGGSFYWDGSSTETDDGGTIITPTFSGFGGTGRWKRVTGNVAKVEWFDGNAGSQIASAIDWLPSSGGVVDCSFHRGTQAINSDIFASREKHFILLLGPATYEIDISTYGLTLNTNQKIIGQNSTIQPTVEGADANSNLAGIIETRLKSTTGSINSGSNILTVNDTSIFEEECVVAVEGAAGSDQNEQTSLTSSITSSDTTIPVNDASTFPGSGTLLIESEVIQYSNKDATNFLSVTRGALGTTAASHGNGVSVDLMNHFRATVEDVGTNITLDENASFNVTNAEVLVGVKDVSLDGELKINGRQDRAASDPPSGNIVGVYGNIVNNLSIGDSVEIINCDHVGTYLESAYRCDIKGKYRKNGRPSENLGADIFLIRGSTYNDLRPSLLEDGHIGIFIDDRTTSADKLDGSSNYNYVILPSVTKANAAFEISGSSDNAIFCPYIDISGYGGETAMKIQNGSQGANPRNSRRNSVFAGYVDAPIASLVSRDQDNSIIILKAVNTVDDQGNNDVRILGKIPQFERYFTQTATIDFGSIATNSRAVSDVTVTGAQVGDEVVVNANLSDGTWAGVTIGAWVESADTVRIQATNVRDDAAKDPVSTDFHIVVRGGLTY